MSSYTRLMDLRTFITEHVKTKPLYVVATGRDGRGIFKFHPDVEAKYRETMKGLAEDESYPVGYVFSEDEKTEARTKVTAMMAELESGKTTSDYMNDALADDEAGRMGRKDAKTIMESARGKRYRQYFLSKYFGSAEDVAAMTDDEVARRYYNMVNDISNMGKVNHLIYDNIKGESVFSEIASTVRKKVISPIVKRVSSIKKTFKSAFKTLFIGEDFPLLKMSRGEIPFYKEKHIKNIDKILKAFEDYQPTATSDAAAEREADTPRASVSSPPPLTDEAASETETIYESVVEGPGVVYDTTDWEIYDEEGPYFTDAGKAATPEEFEPVKTKEVKRVVAPITLEEMEDTSNFNTGDKNYPSCTYMDDTPQGRKGFKKPGFREVGYVTVGTETSTGKPRPRIVKIYERESNPGEFYYGNVQTAPKIDTTTKQVTEQLAAGKEYGEITLDSSTKKKIPFRYKIKDGEQVAFVSSEMYEDAQNGTVKRIEERYIEEEVEVVEKDKVNGPTITRDGGEFGMFDGYYDAEEVPEDTPRDDSDSSGDTGFDDYEDAEVYEESTGTTGGFEYDTEFPGYGGGYVFPDADADTTPKDDGDGSGDSGDDGGVPPRVEEEPTYDPVTDGKPEKRTEIRRVVAPITPEEMEDTSNFEMGDKNYPSCTHIDDTANTRKGFKDSGLVEVGYVTVGIDNSTGKPRPRVVKIYESKNNPGQFFYGNAHTAPKIDTTTKQVTEQLEAGKDYGEITLDSSTKKKIPFMYKIKDGEQVAFVSSELYQDAQNGTITRKEERYIEEEVEVEETTGPRIEPEPFVSNGTEGPIVSQVLDFNPPEGVEVGSYEAIDKDGYVGTYKYYEDPEHRGTFIVQKLADLETMHRATDADYERLKNQRVTFHSEGYDQDFLFEVDGDNFTPVDGETLAREEADAFRAKMEELEAQEARELEQQELDRKRDFMHNGPNPELYELGGKKYPTFRQVDDTKHGEHLSGYEKVGSLAVGVREVKIGDKTIQRVMAVKVYQSKENPDEYIYGQVDEDITLPPHAEYTTQQMAAADTFGTTMIPKTNTPVRVEYKDGQVTIVSAEFVSDYENGLIGNKFEKVETAEMEGAAKDELSDAHIYSEIHRKDFDKYLKKRRRKERGRELDMDAEREAFYEQAQPKKGSSLQPEDWVESYRGFWESPDAAKAEELAESDKKAYERFKKKHGLTDEKAAQYRFFIEHKSKERTKAFKRAAKVKETDPDTMFDDRTPENSGKNGISAEYVMTDEEQAEIDSFQKTQLSEFISTLEHEAPAVGPEVKPEAKPAGPVVEALPTGIEAMATDCLYADLKKNLGDKVVMGKDGKPVMGKLTQEIIKLAASSPDKPANPELVGKLKDILTKTYESAYIREILEAKGLDKLPEGEEAEKIVGEAREKATKKVEFIEFEGLKPRGKSRLVLTELSKGYFNPSAGKPASGAEEELEYKRDTQFYKGLVEAGMVFDLGAYEKRIRQTLQTQLRGELDLLTGSDNTNKFEEVEVMGADGKPVKAHKVVINGIEVYLSEDHKQILEVSGLTEVKTAGKIFGEINMEEIVDGVDKKVVSSEEPAPRGDGMESDGLGAM